MSPRTRRPKSGHVAGQHQSVCGRHLLPGNGHAHHGNPPKRNRGLLPPRLDFTVGGAPGGRVAFRRHGGARPSTAGLSSDPIRPQPDGAQVISALLREIEPLRSELRFCGDGRRCVAVRCKPPKRPLIGSPPQSLARLSHWSPFSRQGDAGLHPFASAALWRRMVVGDGFEPSKALAGGFTVRPRWPLE